MWKYFIVICTPATFAFNCFMFMPEIFNQMVSVNGKHPWFWFPVDFDLAKSVGFFRQNGRLPKITRQLGNPLAKNLGQEEVAMLGVWARVEISKSIVFLNLVISAGSCHHPVEVRKDWDLGFYLTVLVDLVINHAADKEIGRSYRVESRKVRRWVEEWVRSRVRKHVMRDNATTKQHF